MKRILLLSTLILGLNSCKKLPNYYCVNQDHIDFTEVNYSGYDKVTGLRWLIFKDATHFNLWIDTDNLITQNKMLYTGFKIYFDEDGKRNRHTSFYFPAKTEKEFTMKDLGGSFKDDYFSIGQPNRLDKAVTEISKDAVFSKYESKEEFNYLFDKSDIKVELTPKEESLTYKLKIPLEKIVSADSKHFALGIESGVLNFELPEGMQAPNQNVARPNTTGSPGNRGTSVMGSGIGGKQNNLSTFNQIEEPLKVWFKVNLTDL